MFSSRRVHIHPFRAIFWTVAVLASVLVFLDHHPFRLAAEDPRIAGLPLSIEGDSDYLVVVDSPSIVERSSRGAYERSWAWVDLVRQELGPVTVTEVEELDAELLQDYGVVIMTQSAATSSPAQMLVSSFDTYVRHGGLLVLELPSGGLRDAFAADGGGGWRRPGTITATEGVNEEVAAQLRDIPLLTRLMGSTRPLEGAETIMAMDGAPVIYDRLIGEGAVIVFDFDVGAELNAIHQGLPGEDGRVVPMRSGDMIHASDMVAAPELVGSDVPYGDLLERYIAHVVLARHRPPFVLWTYPHGGHGALILSHQTRTGVGRPLWMSIHEREVGARTATFITPPPSRQLTLNDREEFVGHAALTWSLSPDEPSARRAFGLFGIEPVVQTRTLVDQLEALEHYLGEHEDVQGVHILDGAWTPEPVAPFQAMAATQTAGGATRLRYSVSYMPSSVTPPGYLFGSCQPFTPLDANGLPFDWTEIPVCFVDPQIAQDREALMGTLERAALEGWAVHLMTSADLFVDAPNMNAFDIWRDAMRFAERNDMWVGGAGQLRGFWRARQNATFHVQTSAGQRRERDGELTSIEYNLEIQTSGEGHALVFPSTFRGLSFASARRGTGGSDRVPLADRVEPLDFSVLGMSYELILLNTGFSNFTIRYEN